MEKKEVIRAIDTISNALRSVHSEEDDVRKVLNEKLIELVKQL